MKKEKEGKLGFKRTFKNIFYAIRFLMRNVPLHFITRILYYVVMEVVAFSANTYVLKYVVSAFENKQAFEAIIVGVVYILTIPPIIEIITTFLDDLLQVRARLKMEKVLLHKIYEKSTSVELACYENPEYYDGFQKGTNDIHWRFLDFIWSVASFVSILVSLILYGTLLFKIDPMFILFALIPLVATFTKKYSNELWHKHTTEDQIANRRRLYAQRVFYSVEYAKEIRLTNADKFILERYDIASEGRKDVVRKYGVKESFLDAINLALLQVISNPIAMIYAIFKTVVLGSLGIRDCVVVVNSVGSMTRVFQSLGNRLFDFHGSALFIEDYRKFVEYEPKMVDSDDSKDASVGEIRFENVSFKYDGSDTYALKNINLSIGENEKIALVGHNGAGKSTLIKLMLRLYDPTDGIVSMDGDNAKNVKMESWRDKFGVVFQDFKIMALPVVENVLKRPRVEGDEEKVIDALKKSGIYEKISKLPEGIETQLTKEFDENGENLSIGESQKIAIAHAFVKNAPFIILDEPTSALDPVAEAEMYANMMKAGEGKGMIFISHRLSSAVSADKIYMLENGEIIESGTHTELMLKNGKYADMFEKQAKNYVEQKEGDLNG